MWLARSLPPLALLSRLRRPASAHRHSLVLGGTSRAYASADAGNNLYTLDSKSSSMLNLDEYAVPHWEVGRGPTEPFTPYKDSYVSACALHPDGRTIFVSVRRRSGDYRTSFVEEDPEQEAEKKDPERWSVRQLGTFALDTQSEWECWTQYGTWYLPFEGQAHYDSDLGAWVGKTHAARDGQGYRNDEHEHLCSYDVPDLRKEEEEEEDEGTDEEEDEGEEEDEEVEREKLVDGVCPPPVPRWSLAAEKLTFLEPKLKSTGRAVLLHTGGRGTFCLVERALRKGVSSSRSKADGDGDDCLLRVTMCRIRYNRNGELVAAPLWSSRSYLTTRYAPYWPGRSYLTPSDVKDFDVRAFWI
ncbi:hypothetical protein VPH35_140735 [Triticum aestivum]|uniref:Uncharacterized protein n=1 Tax=Aegilops tauschii TaxID=37682 RepID=M8BZK1_AEGTA